MPITLGGTDDLNNLIACCKKCNQLKHVKHPLDWKPSYIFLKNTNRVDEFITDWDTFLGVV
jgi:5-methylcytosine-specific restriction endonuclease McrA